MRNIIVGAAFLAALSASFAAHADAIRVDCSAFKPTGPTSFAILGDTTVTIGRVSHITQVTFDPSLTLNPGDVIVGQNGDRYDIFEVVRDRCVAKVK
jgi:hypothetical protein